ncbi:hypothetical protein H8B02_37855 [Bradyrhizobium sp. Pear77]|uniref:hypothetical protein n=1 Tax=Bradyrhizobium TaxID=374 RepID=UPI001E634CCB|nr:MULTISPECIES: hypothetical protein [Bradyrhizobium]MCC8958979.1 hypothetical protein [Bradyrhizobium altum]MCC8967565.1 hypothetical protein [Bradyrhizobium oropedii]
MEEVLFQKSFYQVWQLQMQAAVADVQKLDGKLFKYPSLGGVLQSISEKYNIEVVRFQGQMTAERRTEERQRQDGWGDYRMMKRHGSTSASPSWARRRH